MPKRSLHTCMTTCMNHQATDSIYDPLKQTKKALWCFARLTINSVSGCFRRFSGKFLKKTERLKRCIRLFSWLENSRRKFGFHVFKPFLNISFRLSRPLFVNSVHHLPKLWSDQFTRVGKALCPKACDTASSHRYLQLGTFRQRAVRGGCIAEYAFYTFCIIVYRSNDRSLQYL